MGVLLSGCFDGSRGIKIQFARTALCNIGQIILP